MQPQSRVGRGRLMGLGRGEQALGLLGPGVVVRGGMFQGQALQSLYCLSAGSFSRAENGGKKHQPRLLQYQEIDGSQKNSDE